MKAILLCTCISIASLRLKCNISELLLSGTQAHCVTQQLSTELESNFLAVNVHVHVYDIPYGSHGIMSL